MNSVDWIIIAIIVVSCLISIQRGLVKELISLLVWLAALITAIVFYEPLALLLHGLINSPSLRSMVAFGTLFITVLIVGALLNYFISTLVKKTGLSGTDRVLGLLFGIVRAIVIIMVLLIVSPLILPVDQEAWWQQSRLIPYFELMDQWFKEVFEQLVMLSHQYMDR